MFHLPSPCESMRFDGLWIEIEPNYGIQSLRDVLDNGSWPAAPQFIQQCSGLLATRQMTDSAKQQGRKVLKRWQASSKKKHQRNREATHTGHQHKKKSHQVQGSGKSCQEDWHRQLHAFVTASSSSEVPISVSDGTRPRGISGWWSSSRDVLPVARRCSVVWMRWRLM